MSRRRLKWTVALLCAALFLSGCGETVREAELMETAGENTNTEKDRSLTEVRYGDMLYGNTAQQACTVLFRLDEELLCEEDYIGLCPVKCYVKSGDEVKRGDPLVRFALTPDERLEEKLNNAVTAAQYALEADTASAMSAVTAAQANVSACTPGTAAAEIAGYQLSRAWYRYEHLDKTALEDAEEALAEYEEQVAGLDYCAPFDGIVEAMMKPKDEPADEETKICRLFSKTDLRLRVNNSSAEGFHYGARVDIYTGGQKICEGTVYSVGELLVVPDPGVDPVKLRGVNNSALVVLHQEKMENVLMVPKTVLHQKMNGQYVLISRDGVILRRSIQIGMEGKDADTGKPVVQVMDGLEAGDMVFDG